MKNPLIENPSFANAHAHLLWNDDDISFPPKFGILTHFHTIIQAIVPILEEKLVADDEGGG